MNDGGNNVCFAEKKAEKYRSLIWCKRKILFLREKSRTSAWNSAKRHRQSLRTTANMHYPTEKTPERNDDVQ
jgi:hypothetical protein